MNLYPALLTIRVLNTCLVHNFTGVERDKNADRFEFVGIFGATKYVREVQLEVTGLIDGSRLKSTKTSIWKRKSAGFIVDQKVTVPPVTPNRRTTFRPCVNKSHLDITYSPSTTNTTEHQPSTSYRTLRRWSLGECHAYRTQNKVLNIATS